MTLSDPYEILEVRNRSVMAPLTRYNSSSDGMPTIELADYYIRRARLGVGLIIVESCAINPLDGMGYQNGAQFFSTKHAEAWKPIVEKIHKAGAKVWLQLFHPGRLTVKEISKCAPLAPTSIKPGNAKSFWRPNINEVIVNFQTLTPYEIPSEISVSEIQKVISQFANSSKLASIVGFDGIEIHGAHGYLVHQFNSRTANLRNDEFGFSENFTFTKQLISSCKNELSPQMKLSFRLSSHMIDNPLIRFNEEEDKFKHLMQIILQSGVDNIHCSSIDSKKSIFGSDRPLHQIVRKYTDKPIIVCGGIRTIAEANAITESDENALIAFGRNFISNPDLIMLMLNENEERIIPFSYDMHINKIY